MSPGARTRTFYRLTSEGRTLWSRRESIGLPEDYRRILGVVESCGHKDVVRSRLARYPEAMVEGWLKQFEALNLIELTWVERPGFPDLRLKAAPPALERDEQARISADARVADISLSRLGAYVDHERVVNRPPHRKEPRSTLALVVEDDPDQLALALLRLTRAGYRVQGADSVSALIDSLQKCKPDALFLDIMLPDGDGFEILTALRQHPAHALLPIIMVTAKTEPENIAKGLALGADAYVTKPYGSNTLDYVLRYVLQHELPDTAPALPPIADQKAPAPLAPPQPELRAEPAEISLKTPEDVHALLTEVAMYREGDEARKTARWHTVKRLALIIGLMVAVFQYYMMDTLFQMVTVQQVPVFLPVTSLDLRSAAEAHVAWPDGLQPERFLQEMPRLSLTSDTHQSP
jgi:CheY-like chemotaxis protein